MRRFSSPVKVSDHMSSIRCQISVSLDGYVAGPNQSTDEPLGEGGERLHEWALTNAAWREAQGLGGGERNAASEVLSDVVGGIGAYVRGRGMFGGGEEAGAPRWKGWGGDAPPFHAPVFVL